jgi:hypothetical protein
VSVSFEIDDTAGERWLGLDAYSTDLTIEMAEMFPDPDEGYGLAMTISAARAREFRRFLEYCYPASEDEPHGPDPWEGEDR